MMMSSDNKKVAMLIIRGLANKANSNDMEQGVATSGETEKDDSKMPAEMAMAEFIEAIHEKDAKKATKAYMDFKDLCSGMEYHKGENSHEEY